MLRLVAPFILFLPALGAWFNEDISLKAMLGIAVGLGVLCLYQLSTRVGRTPQYEIICRMFLTAWIPGLLMAYAFYWSFWTVTYLCMAGVVMYLVGRWLLFVVFRPAIWNDVKAFEALGHSWFWDTIPSPWNPDIVSTSKPPDAPLQRQAPPPQAPSKSAKRGPFVPVEPRRGE